MKWKKLTASILASGALMFGVNSFADAADDVKSKVPAPVMLSDKTSKNNILYEKLNNELSKMFENGAAQVLGFGVIAYKDGEEVYSNFQGKSHIDKDKLITRDTRFRVASISKMFTSFTLMQLVEQGKINLDTDVSEYLGFKLRNPNFPDTPITVRMLASHTSSLRDGKIYSLPPQYTVKEFFVEGGVGYDDGVHFAKKSTEKPGEYFQYCNLNYGLIGTIIERVTGERFDKYQKNHIFKQLGIKADYVVGNLGKREYENLGTLYQKNKGGVWDVNGDWVAQIDNYNKKPAAEMVMIQNPYEREKDEMYSLKGYKVGTNATIFSPTGGLRISYGELANCLEMLLNHGKFNGQQIISEKSFDEIFKAQWTFDEKTENGNTYGGVMTNYGFGTYKINGDSSANMSSEYKVDLLGHSGEAYGMISGLYFEPNTKNGVIFMINGESVEPDEDDRCFGKYSVGYIWEENMMNPIIKYIFR